MSKMKAKVVPGRTPAGRTQTRPNLYSRTELERLHARLLTHAAAATSDQERWIQLEALIAICSLLLDDAAPLTSGQRIEIQRELLADAAWLGVHELH